jgi:hypothetical protein
MKYLYTLIAATLFSAHVRGQHIGDFTSVNPVDIQDQYITIPQTHAFQLLFHSGDNLTEGGTVGTWSDFTGYVPIAGSSTNGYLCVNSEFVPGGVSVHDLLFDSNSNLWTITASGAVDFSAFSCLLGTVPGTVANCSGGVTPWGTIVTCEENDVALCDFEGHGVHGWNIEIDPATRSVVDYDNSGNPDKAWAMGRMKHENVCFTADSLISYYGDDNSASGYLFKFVMDQKADLSSGTLYTYVLDNQTFNGTWVQVPNQSADDQDNTVSLSANLGATAFDRVEDVELGPDGKIYFASTGADRIYRLNQDGTDFEIYADNVDVEIDYGSGTKMVRFDSPDNLVFDNQGNLWVNQDGGNNYLWVISPNHTLQNPAIRIFANTPRGCESTGTHFTPDNKYMFVSIQHPEASNSNSQADAADQNVTFNKDATLVIALKENLGMPEGLEDSEVFSGLTSFIGTDGLLNVNFLSLIHGKSTVEVFDMGGKLIRSVQLPVHVGKNNFMLSLNEVATGAHIVTVTIGSHGFSTKFVK